MCETRLQWDSPIVTNAAPVEPICASAWIDPIGKFYPVPDCGHYQWAEENFGERAEVLERKGWLHLSFGNLIYEGRIRQAQLDTLFDIMLVYQSHGYGYAERFRETFERVTKGA